MGTEKGMYHFRFYLSDGFNGYLLCENESSYTYISPITYIWIQKLGWSNWEDVIETYEIDKRFVLKLEPINRTNTFEEWFFEYPVNEDTLRHFNDITLFFETFTEYRLASSITSRLEMTIHRMEKRIPIVHLESLVAFAYKHYSKHPDRLRLFYSPLIRKYRTTEGNAHVED